MTTGLRYQFQFQYHRTTAPKRLFRSPDPAPSVNGGAKSPIIHSERPHQGIFQTNFALCNVAENWVHINFALCNVVENWSHINFALPKVAGNWSHINFALSKVAEDWSHINFALGNVAETDNALMMPREIVSSLPASAVCMFSLYVQFF